MSEKTANVTPNSVTVRVVALVPVQQYGSVTIEVIVNKNDCPIGDKYLRQCIDETVQQAHKAVVNEVAKMDTSNTAVSAWLKANPVGFASS